MNINKSLADFNAFVEFAKTELDKVNGDLTRANSMAKVTIGEDGHAVSVSRSKDYKGHVLRCFDGELCAANKAARAAFFESVRNILGKSANTELLQHIREQINIEENSSKPLSARRIILIAREVELARLGADTAVGGLPEVNGFDGKVKAEVRKFAAQKNVNALPLRQLATGFKTVIDRVLTKSEDFEDVRNEMKAAVTDKVDALLAKYLGGPDTSDAAAFRAFRDELGELGRTIEAELGNMGLAPGSRMRSGLFGALHVLKDLTATLTLPDADEFALDLPKLEGELAVLRTRVETLRSIGDTDEVRELAASCADAVEAKYKDVDLRSGSLTLADVDALSRQVVEETGFLQNHADLGKRIDAHVRGAVKSFKETVLESFPGDKTIGSALFISEKDEEKLVADYTKKCREQALTALKEKREPKLVSAESIRDAFSKLCSRHAKDAFRTRLGQLSSQIDEAARKLVDLPAEKKLTEDRAELKELGARLEVLKVRSRQLTNLSELRTKKLGIPSYESQLTNVLNDLIPGVIAEDAVCPLVQKTTAFLTEGLARLESAPREAREKAVKASRAELTQLTKELTDVEKKLKEKTQDPGFKESLALVQEAKKTLSSAEKYLNQMADSVNTGLFSNDAKRTQAAAKAKSTLAAIRKAVEGDVTQTGLARKLAARIDVITRPQLDKVDEIKAEIAKLKSDVKRLEEERARIKEELTASGQDPSDVSEETVSLDKLGQTLHSVNAEIKKMDARAAELEKEIDSFKALLDNPNRFKSRAKPARLAFNKDAGEALLQLESAAELDLVSVGKTLRALEKAYPFASGTEVKTDDRGNLVVEKPKDFAEQVGIRSRFSVKEPGVLAPHVLRQRQGAFRAIIADSKDLNEEARKDLLAKFDAFFDETRELPKTLVELASRQCEGASDVNVATSRVRKYFNSYFKCLVHNVAKGVETAYDAEGVPVFGEEELAGFQTRSGFDADLNDTGVSAFGHAGQIGRLADLLGKMSSDQSAMSLARRLDRLVAGFKLPPDVKSVNVAAYKANYLEIFKARLAEKPSDAAEKTRLLRMTELLDQIDDIESVDDPDDRALIIASCDEFCRLAEALPAEVAASAKTKTLNGMDQKTRLLRECYQGGSSLDADAIIRHFTDALKIDRAAYDRLTLEDVTFVLPFVEKARGLRFPALAHFKPFFDSLLEPGVPRSLFSREGNGSLADIVFDLVSLKARWDNGVPDGDADGRIKPNYDSRYSSGFGTYDVKEIVCALAGDGLTDLGYVRDTKERLHGRPATDKLLSFLWEFNDHRLNGLPEVCMRVFGKSVGEVTLEDFNEVDARMLENRKAGRPTLQGLDPLKTMMEDDGKTADKELKAVVRMLSGDLTSGIETWKTKPNLATVNAWVKALTGLQSGDAASADLEMNGRRLRFTRSSTGFLSANVIDTKAKPAAATRIRLHVPMTPRAFAADCLRQLLVSAKTAELAAFLPGGAAASDLLDLRDTAFEIIRRFKPELKAVSCSHISTDELVGEARGLLASAPKKAKGPAAPSVTDRKVGEQMNAQNVLELIDRLEAAKRKEGAGKIDSIVRLPPKPAVESEDPEQDALRGFVADLLSFGRSWETDRLPDFRARMRYALTSDPAQAAKLLELDDDALTKKLATLGHANLSAELVKVFSAVRSRIGGEVTADSLGVAFDAAFPAGDAALETAVKAAVDLDMKALQSTFKTEFVDKLLSSSASSVELQSLREIAGTETIDKENGYGLFLTEVMKRYFNEMDDTAKLAMLAGVVRGTTDASSPVERITALVKNAGPVFLKLVQGIPEGAVPENEPGMLKLLGDVKDSLPPIPDEVVQAQLFDMVVRSQGAITGIDVVRSLGAASVGQALLCRVRTVYNPDGEECVIKLLRPNVQNSAQRERGFIQGCLDDTPGMAKTFAGRLDGIMDEMDLTKEAGNVRLGRVYANGPAEVESMELHSTIPPTELALVVRKAPGTTCEKYFKSVEKRTDELLKKHERTVVIDGRKVTRHYATSYSDFVTTRDGLYKLHRELSRRQEHLLALTRRWADECLFGAGFFHGDLHAGNIMMDEGVATFIDYGNAVRLTTEERKQLIRMLATCGYGNHGGFLTELKELLPGKELGITADDEKKLTADLATTLAKGSMNDSGLRIAAAVNLLQRYGVPVPPTLYNFSQSMLRLQAAVDRGNTALQRLQTAFESLEMDPAVLAEEKVKIVEKDGTERIEDYFDPFESFLQDHYRARTDMNQLDVLGGTVLSKRVEAERNDGTVKPRILLEKPAQRRGNEVGSVYWTLLELCKDRDSVRNRLLPLLKRHRSFYAVKPDRLTIPAEEDREGYQAYRLALDMVEGDFDFSDANLIKARVQKIGALVEKRVLGTARALFRQAPITFPPHTTFSKVFSACLHSNVEEVTPFMRKYVLDLGKVKNANKDAEREDKALKGLYDYAAGFLEEHPAFSPSTAQKILASVNSGFIFVAGSFRPQWEQGVILKNAAAQAKEPYARILLSNVRRVRDLLATEGYKPEDDGGMTLDEAVQLAFTLYGVKYDLFTPFAGASAAKGSKGTTNFRKWLDSFDSLEALDGKGKVDPVDADQMRKACDFLAGTDINRLAKKKPPELREEPCQLEEKALFEIHRGPGSNALFDYDSQD